ncbi:MAG: ABC transporter permease [Fimbriimonadaceae bacterium]
MAETNAIRPADPPFSVAWHQARASIRVRFFRQAITTLGIALGIAFFTSMQLMSVAESATADADTKVRTQWLVATSMVMCLVGVTNSMLMSVTERYREIGTIKCLGASDSFIVKVFFLEAMLLGAIGSFAGSVIGAGATGLYLWLSNGGGGIGAMLSVIAIGTLLGMVLTVISSIAPAIQAAKMPAAAALRVEV